MPLTPATTDKFMKVGDPGSATTLSAPGYTIGDTSINVGSTSAWPTDTLVAFAIDRAEIVSGVEQRVAGTYNEFTGIVTSAGVISNLTKTFGTAQDYAAGSLTRVYIPVSSTRENALIDGIRQDHNGKGNHENLTDDNGNEWLERGQTTNAVNQLKVSNAATGNAPVGEASGGDTNIDLKFKGKGTGRVYTDLHPPLLYAQEGFFDFVASGGVWSGDAYGSTRAASMTALVCYINGRRISISAVTARSFTASKDTYIDVLDNADGTGTLVYTEVTNNDASPALASNSIRIGIIVTGASNIANVGSVNQGQEDKILPIASSVAYSVTDSLGNLICSRDPNRKVLGYRQIVANVSSLSNNAQVTGLTCPYKVPTGRKVKTTIRGLAISGSASGGEYGVAVWDGTVGSGTRLGYSSATAPANATLVPFATEAETTPSSSSKTYNAGSIVGSGTGTYTAASTAPAFIRVELI